MIFNAVLSFFNIFIAFIGGLFADTSFYIDYDLFDNAFGYVRMALWFLPASDIVLILGLYILVNNFQVVVRVLSLLRSLI